MTFVFLHGWRDGTTLVCKGNKGSVMLTSDLKFILTGDSSEHYYFVAYFSVKSALRCWQFLSVRNKNF